VCHPYLAEAFLHELVHVGSELDFRIPQQKVQGEIDAYACEFVCAVERGYETGLPGPPLGYAKYPCGGTPSVWLADVCATSWSWEELFLNNSVFGVEGCPAPVIGQTTGFACQPSPSGLNEPPVCQRCCPATGVDPDCNPNMKCWMDFAPQSPQGQLEFEKLCQSLGLSGTDCTHNLPACVKAGCKVERVVDNSGVARCVDSVYWELDDQMCDDGVPCTQDICTFDGCINEGAHLLCDDGDPCTADFCEASSGGCVHTPVSSPECPKVDCPGCLTPQCEPRALTPCVCVPDATLCNDHNPCTEDLCFPSGTCAHRWICENTPPTPPWMPIGGGHRPGADNPDESFSPPDMHAKPSGTETFLHALVLQTGLFEQLASVLEKTGVTPHIIGVDFLPEEVFEIARVLFVPTGGLAGIYGLQSFSERLRRFAEIGGVVVVLSQPKGYMYEAVTKDITAYGWWESQSCFFGGADVAMRHPVVSSASQKTIALPIDGGFVEGEGIVVLLRKGSGGSPVMVMKVEGEGRIVMTGMYPDYAYFNGQSSEEALDILRDIVSWGEAPDHVPVYDPEKPIVVEFEKEVHWKVVSPDGKETVAEGYGNKAQLVIQKGKGGVYHVFVEEAGEWKVCRECRFSVMGFEMKESLEPFTVTITTPSEQYFYGDNATFSVVITSHTDKEMDVHCRWWVWQGGFISPYEGGDVSLTLEPNETKSFGGSVKVRDFGWFYVKCDNDDGYNIMTRKSFFAVTPEVSLEVETERPGEPVDFLDSLVPELTSLVSAALPATCVIRYFNSPRPGGMFRMQSLVRVPMQKFRKVGFCIPEKRVRALCAGAFHGLSRMR